MLFVKANAIRGNLPIGVRRQKNSNKFESYCTYDNKFYYLGTYTTSEKAFYTYKEYKENLIKKVAEEEYCKGNIIKSCYEAMMKYQVEITD